MQVIGQDELKKSPVVPGISTNQGVNPLRSQLSFEAHRILQTSHYYELYPPENPKSGIADYVESNGILVPKRFSSKSEAIRYINQGGRVELRSEHVQEFAGVSGLASSYSVDSALLLRAEECIADQGTDFILPDAHRMQESKKVIGQMRTLNEASFQKLLALLSIDSIRRYILLSGADLDEFMAGFSYSYWEHIPGFNRSIMADTAIANRYHIFTAGNGDDTHSYIVVENGRIIRGELQNSMLSDELANTISWYESIRNFARFDGVQTPIIEFQTTPEGDNYFLQYHKSNQINLHQHTLGALEEGEIEADFVRGSTSPEGIVVSATLGSEGVYMNEEASFDLLRDHPIDTEFLCRGRKLNIISGDLGSIASLTANNHMQKSRLLKGGASVVLYPNKIPDWIRQAAVMWKTKKFPRKGMIPIRIRLRSDGKKAYLKILTTKHEYESLLA